MCSTTFQLRLHRYSAFRCMLTAIHRYDARLHINKPPDAERVSGDGTGRSHNPQAVCRVNNMTAWYLYYA